MATIDFTTATPTGCGCTNRTDGANVSAAIGRWHTFARDPTKAPPTLTMDATGGPYNTTSPADGGLGETNGFPAGTVATLQGVGGKVSFNGAWSSGGFNGFVNFGNFNTLNGTPMFIKKAIAGSTTITLKNSSDLANVDVGQWGIIGCAECQAGPTFPPSWNFYEYFKIVGISGTILTLATPLTQTYYDTFPLVPNANDGAACIYVLGGSGTDYSIAAASALFDCTVNLQHFDMTGVRCQGQPIRNLIVLIVILVALDN